MEKLTTEKVMNSEELQKEIIAYIAVKFSSSSTFVSNKRTLFKEWFKQYTNQEAHRDHIVKIYTLHRHLKWFISTFYDSWLAVEFSPRETWDDDFAYKLTKMAEYDTKAMRKNVKDFQHFWNLWFYGVALRQRTWRDIAKWVPTYEEVSPKYWYPDPTWNIIRWFSYHMFATTYTAHEMETINAERWKVFFNIDKARVWLDSEYELMKRSSEWERLVSSVSSSFEVIGALDCSIEYKWHKYLVTLSNNRSLMIRFEPVEPVDKIEKKHPSEVPHPVSVSNMFPLEDDPFGIWYAELVLSFQTAINRLTNMWLIKEQRNAWFDHILVDTTKIQNIDLLKEKNANWPTFIPANGMNGPLSNATSKVIDDQWVHGNTLAMSDRLDLLAQYQTGQTNENLWLPGQRDDTLGESQQQQINSNIMFGLDSEIISIGEVDFWQNIRYRGLKEYLSKYDEKILRIWSWLASLTLKLKRNELLSWLDPDISIVNKKLEMAKRQKKIAYMVAREPMLMQNPNTPMISKLLFARELDRLNDVPREKIYLNTPLTPDERRAIGYMEMINNDITPENLFIPGMDLFTYYIYISWCEENDIKRKIMSILEKEMINQWLNKPQVWPELWWPQNAVASSNASQMTSNFIRQMQPSKIASRADVSNLQPSNG